MLAFNRGASPLYRAVIVVILCQRQKKAIPNGYLLMTNSVFVLTEFTVMCFMTKQNFHGKSQIHSEWKEEKIFY